MLEVGGIYEARRNEDAKFVVFEVISILPHSEVYKVKVIRSNYQPTGKNAFISFEGWIAANAQSYFENSTLTIRTIEEDQMLLDLYMEMALQTKDYRWCKELAELKEVLS